VCDASESPFLSQEHGSAWKRRGRICPPLMQGGRNCAWARCIAWEAGKFPDIRLIFCRAGVYEIRTGGSISNLIRSNSFIPAVFGAPAVWRVVCNRLTFPPRTDPGCMLG
jgi:hypothetical protein